MKLLAFGASNSRHSINKSFASFAATKLSADHDVELIDINNFDAPIYSIDTENEAGIPQAVHEFLAKIDNADLVLISFAEHNGSYCAAYKSLFDWASRIRAKVYEGKDMILLSTSPGKRGGASVLETALAQMPRFGGNVLGHMSLPEFHTNFVEGQLANAEYAKALDDLLALIA